MFIKLRQFCESIICEYPYKNILMSLFYYTYQASVHVPDFVYTYVYNLSKYYLYSHSLAKP